MSIIYLKDDENAKETVRIRIIMRLFSYLRPYKRQTGEVIILIGIVTGVTLLNPYFHEDGH